MQRFPETSWDVTNNVEYCLSCCMLSVMLILEEEEAVLRTSNCCSTSAQRRPYAQLNSVELHTRWCNTCQAIGTDLVPVTPDGEGGLIPGCGCNKELTGEIITELNARKDGRGKIAQIKQQTFMLERINKLKVQLPVVLQHFGVAYPPDEATVARLFGNNPPAFRAFADVLGWKDQKLEEFGTRHFDVTCCCDPVCCTHKTLELGPDEVVLTKVSGISRNTVIERRPYAQIDDVQAVSACGCLKVLAAGNLTDTEPIQPGNGCNAMLVEEIRSELQARVTARGNVGQIFQLEKMTDNVQDLAAEMPLLMDKLGAETVYPPSQQTMSKIYGAAAPKQPPMPPERPHQVASQAFPVKTYDNVNNQCDAACLMCICCCIPGCTKKKLTLAEEEVVVEVKNNITESVTRMPYAQLGSVDEGRCCCCTGVNGISPGWGCSYDLVKEISEELQARKVGRGNIAQLRNQENTMYKALEVDVRTDIVLKHLDIMYPPTQETLTSLYGQTPPTLPTDEAERGSGIHIQASSQFETRSWPITNWCDKVCCQDADLEVNDEEAVVSRSGPCCRSKMREPYAQMGSVEVRKACCGLLTGVSTDSTAISPECGCSHALVEDISGELQSRKVARGNIAQIRQQENLMIEIIKLAVKLDLITTKNGLEYPPSQATMDKVFGQGATVPDKDSFIQAQPQPRSSRSSTTMSVIVPQNVNGGELFSVKGPRGSFQVPVPEGSVGGQRIIVDVPRHPLGETEMAPLNG